MFCSITSSTASSESGLSPKKSDELMLPQAGVGKRNRRKGSVQSEHTLLAYGLNIFAIPETLSRAPGFFFKIFQFALFGR
jgi:hypothetical protein